jgi:hypothetical protein
MLCQVTYPAPPLFISQILRAIVGTISLIFVKFLHILKYLGIQRDGPNGKALQHSLHEFQSNLRDCLFEENELGKALWIHPGKCYW